MNFWMIMRFNEVISVEEEISSFSLYLLHGMDNDKIMMNFKHVNYAKHISGNFGN